MGMQKRKLKISTTQSKLGQCKEGQMKLSFGMIFSIILMIIFVSVAFYAIQKFLALQNSTQIAKFARDLQGDIDKMWKGSKGSQSQEYFLPGKIEYVCFIDYTPSSGNGRYDDFFDELRQFNYDAENLFFYPPGSAEGLDSKEMKNLDINKITDSENPFCLRNTKGKVKMVIKKEFGEALVTITD